MKKIFLYSLAVLASVALASCNGDYDDWAQPQHNPQEEAITIPGFTATPVVQSIDCSSVTTDSVSTFTLSEAALPEGFTLDNARLEIIPQGEDNAIKKNVNASIEGKSAVADLSEVIVSYYGKRPIAHSFVAHVYLNAVKNGDAVLIDAGKFNLEMTPKSPFIDSGYYLVGDMFKAEDDNGWSIKAAKAFMHSDKDVYDDPVFTITFETKEADQYWKIIPKKNIDAGDLWADGVVGPKENGSISEKGDLTNVGPGAGMIKEPGKYKLTLNMMDYSYTIEPAPELYMKGDANGWDGYDYLAGDGVHFTGFMYLNQNGFKFTTAPDWSGTGYGANFDTAPDAKNIVITEPAGYYKVEVDLSKKTYTLTPITSIGIIGAATPGGWDAETPLTYNKTERCWEVQDIKLKAGECKFRANKGWDINWGGTPDNLTQNGDNISVEAGTYDIKLYAWANGYAKCEFIKK
ncbi:MAG: DUF5115 domain-containing protein [Prevotella sp.]|nr:DUF5115 domain-containing protein [Prevotella sp.]